MKILHAVGAGVVGLIVARVAVMVIDGISSLIYRMPADLDPNNFEQLSQWILALPAGAFLLVLVAESSGYFLGTFVARLLAPQRSTVPSLIVWAILAIGLICNLMVIPHPLWFAVASIIACLVLGLLGLIAAAPDTYVVCCTRTIDAPIEKVFKTLATIDEFSKAVPHILRLCFALRR